jgi:hypothetical protein
MQIFLCNGPHFPSEPDVSLSIDSMMSDPLVKPRIRTHNFRFDQNTRAIRGFDDRGQTSSLYGIKNASDA